MVLPHPTLFPLTAALEGGRPDLWTGRSRSLVAGLRRRREVLRPDRALLLLRRAVAFLGSLRLRGAPLLVVLPEPLDRHLAPPLRRRGHQLPRLRRPGALSNWRTTSPGPLPAALLLLDPHRATLLEEARRLGLAAVGQLAAPWDPAAVAYPLPRLDPEPLAALLLPTLVAPSPLRRPRPRRRPSAGGRRRGRGSLTAEYGPEKAAVVVRFHPSPKTRLKWPFPAPVSASSAVCGRISGVTW